MITGFVWAADGSAALVWVQNPYDGEQRALLYDAVAGTLSVLPRPEGIDASSSDLGAAWAPDSSAVLVSTAVSEGDHDQLLIENTQPDMMSALWLVELAAGTPKLLGYVPRLRVPSTIGAWNANGDVLIAGYHLQLARE